jgi:hypothetical protein
VTIGQPSGRNAAGSGSASPRSAACPQGFLSTSRNGLSSLDERPILHAVTDAVRVPVAKLTGQPYDPATRQAQTVRAAVADIRRT